MFNEFDKEEDSWRPPQKRWWVITKKVLSIAIGALMVLFIGILILRSCISQPPNSMTELIWSEDALDAYKTAKQNKEEFKIYEISSSQSFDQGDGDDDKSDDTASAMVSVYSTYYMSKINEIQFSVRYNNRLFNYLFDSHPEAKSLYEDEKELYTYTLRFEYADEEYAITDFSLTKDEKGGYTYRRLIFDIGENVHLENIALMTLEISYVGEPDNVRHMIYIYKTGFGMTEYDYDAPKSATKGIIKKENVFN